MGDILIRIGNGYDVHKLVSGRKLIIGGVCIPYESGLLGHSDADVLLHAIMDSLLGAIAKGDIGKHFPDTNKEFKDISSIELLKRVKNIIDIEKYRISNIDAIIIAQNPKMSLYIEEMRANISQALYIEINQINIKATTEEGLGFTGDGSGISAQAVCLLESSN